jgi:hypothetical protein
MYLAKASARHTKRWHNVLVPFSGEGNKNAACCETITVKNINKIHLINMCMSGEWFNSSSIN